MQENKCPHCGKTFNIDEAGYANIINQVRDEAFDKALRERMALIEQDKKSLFNLWKQKYSAKWRKKLHLRIARSNV